MHFPLIISPQQNKEGLIIHINWLNHYLHTRSWPVYNLGFNSTLPQAIKVNKIGL